MNTESVKTKKAKRKAGTKKKDTSKTTKNASVDPQRLTGKKAPAFTLEDYQGQKYRLNEIESEWKILFFYPKDSTPGCTIEANLFSKDLKKFKALGAEVFGISGGDEKSKRKFVEKHLLKVPMLSDSDFKVSKAYQSYGMKSFMGRKFNGIFRNTFILDSNNKIIKVFEKVKPPTHSKEVLEFIKNQS